MFMDNSRESEKFETHNFYPYIFNMLDCRNLRYKATYLFKMPRIPSFPRTRESSNSKTSGFLRRLGMTNVMANIYERKIIATAIFSINLHPPHRLTDSAPLRLSGDALIFFFLSAPLLYDLGQNESRSRGCRCGSQARTRSGTQSEHSRRG